jgi:hypothetical protein
MENIYFVFIGRGGGGGRDGRDRSVSVYFKGNFAVKQT